MAATTEEKKENLSTLIDLAVRTLGGMGSEFTTEQSRLAGLKDRLAEGRFHLAVLGQFKRGKSTLLNALLGESVLPTSVIPLTAIPTFIRQGREFRIRVSYLDDRKPEEWTAPDAGRLSELLRGLVTESGNPRNHRGVLQVVVFHPSPILSEGLVLIDTPGVGSTFQHNTETALNFLPQCDAALFLVSADPPITEIEIAFLKQVRARVLRLFFILNKRDYLDEEELRAAVEFLRQVLKDQVGLPADVPIFTVSAKQALAARKNGSSRPGGGNIEAIERHLVDFLAREKSDALRAAVSRKAADILAQCDMRLKLAIRSYQIPIEDLRERMAVFERKMEEIRRQRLFEDDLLAGDRRRMHELLEAHAENLRRKAQEYLAGIAFETIARDGPSAEREVPKALAEAIPGFFEHLSGETTAHFRQLMDDAVRPHRERAAQLIASIRKTAAELFEVPYWAPESGETFEIVQEPYWVTHKWTSRLIPMPAGLVDRLLSAAARSARLRKRLFDQVSALVVPNVENLRWAIFQSIDRTFIQFAASLKQKWDDAVMATEGAIRAAMSRRQHHSELAREEIPGLEMISCEIGRIRAELVGD